MTHPGRVERPSARGATARRLLLALGAVVAGCKKPPLAPDGGASAAPAPDGGGEITVREKLIRAQVVISIAAPASQRLEEAVQAAFSEVQALDDVLSDWKEGSELVELNRKAGEGPQQVSTTLFELLKTAKGLAEATGGAFDPTFASLHGLWSFDPEAPRIPTEAELEARLPLVGHRHLQLDEARRTAALAKQGVRVGVGAVSDGFAAHRASQALLARGFPDHLVLIAGDGVARGKKYGRPWRIAIRHPETGGFHGTIDLVDEGISTSGNYYKFFEKDGVRYHHILDPRTGRPARGTSGVTVVAKDARLADGWGTGLFVLGPERGLPVAQEHGLEALWFDESFKVTGTPKMLERVKPL